MEIVVICCAHFCICECAFSFVGLDFVLYIVRLCIGNRLLSIANFFVEETLHLETITLYIRSVSG